MNEELAKLLPRTKAETDRLLLELHAADQGRAEILARKAPGSHVWVNGTHAHVSAADLFESLFGIKLRP